MTPPPRRVVFGRPLVMAAVLALGGCSDPAVLEIPVHDAKGGAKPGDSDGPVVSQADPSSGRQGDVQLEVRILGSGFDQTAQAVWERDGRSDPKIVTLSTRFVSSAEVVATIDIALDAALDLYDIAVYVGIGDGRKKGVGIEMFRVDPRIDNPTATFTIFDRTGAGGGGIQGDGRAANGQPSAVTDESVYDDGQCGVTSEIFENKTGDATMDPIGARASTRNCTSREARSLTVRFGTPLDPAFPSLGDAVGAHFLNVRRVLALGLDGSAGHRRFRPMLRGTATCDNLWYGEMDSAGNGFPLVVSIDGLQVVSNPIKVTRMGSDPSTWEAVSEGSNGDGSGPHVALCEKDGAFVGAYDIPFRIVVVQK